MNERIQELAEQALDYTDQQSKFVDVMSITVEQASDWWDATYNSKFAELIVKECAGIVQTYMSRWPEDAELTKQIKEHFGVDDK